MVSFYIGSHILLGWISRLWVPKIITTVEGRNFDSELLRNFAKMLGCEKTCITAVNAASNGIVKSFHRQLKASLKRHFYGKWSEAMFRVITRNA